MKRAGLLLLLAFTGFEANAMQPDIDSLKQELTKAAGTHKLNILEQLSNYYSESNPALSLSYDSISLQLAAELGNKVGISNILNNMGLSFYALSEYATAIDLISQSLTLKEQIGDTVEIVKSLNNLGALYQLIGDFNSSIGLINRSLMIRRQRNDSIGIARTLNNISIIYMKSGQTDQSFSMLNEALEIYKALENNDGIASVYNNTGTVYQKLKEYENAARYFLMSLSLKNETEDPRSIAITYNNLGMVTQEMGDYQKAMEYYLSSLRLRNQVSDLYGLTTVKINLGTLYRKLTDYAEAEKYLLEACQTATKEQFKESLQRCLRELSLLYADLKNFETAFTYSDQALAYKDSVYNDELNKRIAEVENQRKTQIAYHEKEILRIDNELKSVKIRRQNFNLWMSFGLAGLALIFVYINWLRFREKQRLNKSLGETIEKLTRSEDKLRQANITREKLFSIIAHDLRNPFTNILGFSEMLKKEAKEMNTSEVEIYALYIYDSASQALLLLENLLQWAKIQQEKMIFAPNELVLNKLVKQITSFLYYNANKKQIQLHTQIPEELKILADEEMLKTIIRNLISNAIKFTKSGGYVTLSAVMAKDNLLITVKDNGVGISSDDLVLLFDEGSNPSKHGTANEKGTGLGLILCKEFVEKHGGSIWVESLEGQGSVFSFTIPQK